MSDLPMPQRKKAVVTGGAGFIGSHVCDALVGQFEQIIVLDDLSTGHKSNLNNDVELVVGDIRDRETVGAVVRGADAVFHFAAIASVERCLNDFASAHAVNLGGTINVIDAIRTDAPEARLVWASSAAVYGAPQSLPVTEVAATEPMSSYGLDKLSGEKYSALASNLYGQKIAAMRFFNVVGPRQDPSSPYSGVVSLFVDKMKRGEPVTIFGDGEQTRDFISVFDVVDHVLAAEAYLAASAGPVFDAFNVCVGQTTSINTLFDELKSLTSYSADPTYKDARQGDIRHSLGSPEKSTRLLGQKQRRELAEALAALT